MPNAGKVGTSIAGGVVSGPGATTVLVEGSPISIVGDLVASHGAGAHAAASIVSGSGTVLAQSTPVDRVGDLASCGHAISTGSATVQVG